MKKQVLTHSLIAFITAIVMWFFASSKTEIQELKEKLKIVEEDNLNSKEKINVMEKINRQLNINQKQRMRLEQRVDGSYTLDVESSTNVEEVENRLKEVQTKYEVVLTQNKELQSKLDSYSKIEINKKAYMIGYAKTILGTGSHNIISQADVFNRFGVTVITGFSPSSYYIAPGITIRF